MGGSELLGFGEGFINGLMCKLQRNINLMDSMLMMQEKGDTLV
jgi:hypothetical protein